MRQRRHQRRVGMPTHPGTSPTRKTRTMSLSMYAVGPQRFISFLKNLSSVLGKAAAHAEAHKWEEAALLGARLYPDMFPMSRQVQIACDMAKGCCARLAGVEVPSHPDVEVSFADLQARIAKVIAFIESLPKESFDGSDTRMVALKVRGVDVSLSGESYLMDRTWANFHFHMTTAYALLRHNGVPLGKGDYLG